MKDNLEKLDFYRQVMNAPTPLEGNAPSEYSLAAECICKAILLSMDFNDLKNHKSKGIDPYKIVEDKFPGFDEWLGGATGYMVGWAINAAEYLADLELSPNPALITIQR